MILKTKRIKLQDECCTKEEYERKFAWEFIDKINEITVDGINISPRYIYFQKNEQFLNIILDSECYLLSDEGKTIERLN